MNAALTLPVPHLRPAGRLVLASLYEQQPATPEMLAQRTGLAPAAVDSALADLRQANVLRGGVPLRDGRPGFVWVDLAALWPQEVTA